MRTQPFYRVKNGPLWIISSILVIVACSTAQSPKNASTSQTTGEVGRYVFGSVQREKDNPPVFVILDTKKGRVWFYGASKLNTSSGIPYTLWDWDYYDLNEYTVKQYANDLSESDLRVIRSLLEQGKDTSELWKEWRKVRDSSVAEFEKEIQEKEK